MSAVTIDPVGLNFDIHQVLREHGSAGTMIVFDGFDGTGKSTLVDHVCRRFTQLGRTVVRTRSPRRQALEDPLYAAYLFEPERRGSIDYRGLVAKLTGDRLQHAHQEVLPALARGAVVVLDRYVYSAVAHNYSRGLRSETWFRELCRHLPRPDIAFITDAAGETVRRRLSMRSSAKEAYIEEGHIDACLFAYRQIAEASKLQLVLTDRPLSSSIQEIEAALNIGQP